MTIYTIAQRAHSPSVVFVGVCGSQGGIDVKAGKSVRAVFAAGMVLAAIVVSLFTYGHSAVLAKSSPAGVITTLLNVRKFSTATLTNADSAAIISDANNYLAQCMVTLAQAGDVADASGSPSVINSRADLDQACASTFTAKGPTPLGVARRYRIVNAINWCGSTSTGGTILGCTPTPGTCVVVRRWSSLEGQVLAHEFGHSKGLPHRSDTDAVMYPSIGASHTQFNSGECSSLRTVGLIRSGPSMSTKRALVGSIEDFVKQVYPDGLPYDEARKFGAADMLKISPWLKDQSKANWWSNVATTVGIVAASDAYTVLHELVTRTGSGKLAIEDYDSRVAAIMALGYVVKNNGSTQARRFLESHITPAAWAGVKWMAPYQTTADERNNDLAAAAALGLGRASDPNAIAALRSRLASVRATHGVHARSLSRALEQAITDATLRMSKHSK